MLLPLSLFAPRAAGRLLLTCALAGGLLTASACGDEPAPRRGSNNGNANGEDEDEDDANADDGDVAAVDAGGAKMDGGVKDSGAKPTADAGGKDAGGSAPVDAGGIDAGAKTDVGKTDAGQTTTPDTGTPDTGTADTGTADTGTPDAGTPDTGTPPADGPLCHLEGYEVGIMGDSYIDLSGDFTTLLQDSARAVKALDANETYVDHALSGASMSGTPNIPEQYPDVVADARRRGGKLKVVIMDGGGNDVLIGKRECLNPKSVAEAASTPVCVKVVDDALASGQELFEQAATDGVQAVVFFFYPHLPKDSLLGGPNANNVLDYSAPRIKEWCDSQTKMPCYFVDMRPAFDDPKNPGWPRPGLIAFDGIHPTLEGSKVLAAEVWKVMQTKCIGTK